MSKAKIAVTLEASVLNRVDRMVAEGAFASRSQAVETALREKLDRSNWGRLARECAKLEPEHEIMLAEEGISEDRDSWPEY